MIITLNRALKQIFQLAIRIPRAGGKKHAFIKFITKLIAPFYACMLLGPRLVHNYENNPINLFFFFFLFFFFIIGKSKPYRFSLL